MPVPVTGLQSIKAQVCCYVKEREVWVGRKDGTLHIFDPLSGKNVGEVSFTSYQEERLELYPFAGSSNSNSSTFKRKKVVKVSNDTTQMAVVERAVTHMAVVECSWCSDKTNGSSNIPPLNSPQVWATTASGDVLCFDSLKRKLIYRVKGPLELHGSVGCSTDENAREAESRDPKPLMQRCPSLPSNKLIPGLVDLIFDGIYLVVASESGAVFLLNPQIARFTCSSVVVGRLVLLGPCAALSVMPHFLLCGDQQGRLYCFDRSNWECISIVEEEGEQWKLKESVALQELQGVGKNDDLCSSHQAYLQWKEEKGKRVSFSQHSVTCILYEPTKKTVWVGRRDGRLYVYKIQKGYRLLLLERVIDPINMLRCVVDNTVVQGRNALFSGGEERLQRKAVTSLAAVSGLVLLTTADMSLIVVDAATGRVVNVASAPPGCLVRGTIKVRQKEEALFWSYSHEGGVHEWRVSGIDVAPTCSSSFSGSFSCPVLHFATPNFKAAEEPSIVALGSCENSLEGGCYRRVQSSFVNPPLIASEERLKAVLAAEAMRAITEEAQELRLQQLRIKDIILSKDLEIDQRKKHEEELQEENEKLKKQIMDLTSSQTTSQTELAQTRSECAAIREALSVARTEGLKLQGEKSSWSTEVSSVKIAKSYVEQQLMDAQNTVSGIRAENERLYRSMARMGGMAEKEIEVQKAIEETSDANSAALLQYKKLNRLLTSVMATMEYTIRRKEEEEKDLTCLLNAFRHHVMDHVTDPHLTALLQATIVRNPARFSYSCDSATLAQLQDRSEPIQRFFKALRLEDADAYEKLIAYLQHLAIAGKAPSTSAHPGSSGAGDGGQSLAQDEVSVDKFINLLAHATELSDDAILSFRRSVPIMFVCDASGTPSLPAGSAANSNSARPTTTLETAREAKQEEDVTLRILRDFHSQSSLDSEEMRKRQQTLEFILTTRRGFVDQLGYLYRRLQLAQMACEAIGAPTQMGVSITPQHNSPLPSLQPQGGSGINGGAGPGLQNSVGVHSQLITGISEDLLQTLRSIINRFFTTEEKSRLRMAGDSI